MEELQLAVTASRVDQRNYGLWISNWQIGQTLNALVTNQLPSGDLVLRVGGQQITATSDIPIQQGAQLQLEVKQLDPAPTLRILNMAAAGNAAAGGINATLRILPGIAADGSTTSAAGLFQTLQTAQAMQPLPPPLMASIDALLRLASRPDRLSSADGLREAVRGSGVFMEAKLAQGSGGRDSVGPSGRDSLARDVKAGMLRTLSSTSAALKEVGSTTLNASNAAAGEALSELRRDLESSLSRITLHQVASQSAESQSKSWQLEVPVQWAGAFHTLQIRIDADERQAAPEQNSRDKDEEPWRVDLRVDPPQLGAIELGLRIGEKRLRLDIAASRAETRRLIDGSLGALTAGLASRGLALQVTPARVLEPSAVPAGDAAAGRLDLRV